MGRERGRDSHRLRRQRGTRRRRDVWVFTEGELTEPQYVDLVKGLQPEPVRHAVHIANDTRQDGGQRGGGRKGAGRKPRDLVADAIALKREKDTEVPSDLADEFRPVVWCIFDRDQHDGVDEAISQAVTAGVKVAFSHPCFELWRLLHHQSYTATFGGVCEEAARRLPFAADVSAQRRKAVSIEQIRGGFEQARKRAIQINDRHDKRVPFSRRDPYTDVWKFVEDLGVTSY